MISETDQATSRDVMKPEEVTCGVWNTGAEQTERKGREREREKESVVQGHER